MNERWTAGLALALVGLSACDAGPPLSPGRVAVEFARTLQGRDAAAAARFLSSGDRLALAEVGEGALLALREPVGRRWTVARESAGNGTARVELLGVPSSWPLERHWELILVREGGEWAVALFESVVVSLRLGWLEFARVQRTVPQPLTDRFDLLLAPHATYPPFPHREAMEITPPASAVEFYRGLARQVAARAP